MGIGTALMVGGGLDLLSSWMGSNAARDAASTQAQAAQNANQINLGMYNQTRQDLMPWMTGGAEANLALMEMMGLPVGSYGATPQVPGGSPSENLQIAGNLLATQNGGQIVPVPKASPVGSIPMSGPAPNIVGDNYGIGARPFTMSDLWQDPSYQWRMKQGEDAIINNATTLGGAMSGNTLRALQDYAQGLGSTEYQAAYGRYNDFINNLFNRYSSLSGTGANAAAHQAGIGANVAGTIGENTIGAGNAIAAGQVGSTNALTSGLSGIGNNLLLYQMMKGGGGGSMDPNAALAFNTYSSNTGGF